MVSQGAYLNGPRKSFSGGAGLLSTASDYARFLQMLLNGGELDGKRILSRSTVKLMTVSHTGGIEFRPGQGFGLGLLGGRGRRRPWPAWARWANTDGAALTTRPTGSTQPNSWWSCT